MTSARVLYRRYSERLVDQSDFSAFREIALAEIAGSDTPHDGAAEVEDLLRLIVKDLVDAGRPDAAASAIDRYVADVNPIREAAGLPIGAVGDIAADAGIRDKLGADATFALSTATTSIAAVPVIFIPNVSPAEARMSGALVSAISSGDAETESARSKGTGTDGSASEPEPPLGTRKAAVSPAPARSRINPRATDSANIVGYEKVCEIVTAPLRRRGMISRQKRITLLMTGLSQNGKSFFVQALLRTLGGDYTACDPYGGAIDWGARNVNRTRDILYFDLISNQNRTSISIFDIPGEAFREITTNAGDHQRRARDVNAARQITPAVESDASLQQSAMTDLRSAIYALFATADALIMIEPAVHALAYDHFVDHGDMIDRKERKDRIEALNNGLPEKYQRQVEALAKNLPDDVRTMQVAAITAACTAEIENDRSSLDVRVDEYGKFLNAIGIMANDIHRIRTTGTHRSYRGRADALRMQVEAEINRESSENDSITAPLPLLLLLSRADEYQRLVAGNSGDFDADPALSLVEYNINRFKHYSRWFETFSVDFITAEKKEEADQSFTGNGGDGTQQLLDRWLLPAIRRSRRASRYNIPGRVGGVIARTLRSPRLGAWIRLKIDRTFRESWERQR